MTNLNEDELALSATVEAISHTRRVFMLISAIMAFGYFHLFHWYLSWDKARVLARLGVADVIERRNHHGIFVSGTRAGDSVIIQSSRAGAEALLKSWSDRNVSVPPISMPIPVTDVSTGLMILSAAVLLWLLFYQRRVEWCLRRLDGLQGWETAKRILEYHFVLMGKNASHPMRIAAHGLVWGLPFLGVCFFLSDIFDLRTIYADQIHRLAFESHPYLLAVYLRLGVDLLLVLMNMILGFQCFRAYRATETYILRPSEILGDD